MDGRSTGGSPPCCATVARRSGQGRPRPWGGTTLCQVTDYLAASTVFLSDSS